MARDNPTAPRQMRLSMAAKAGRALGLVCFAAGVVTRSKSLRALGLPGLAERALRRGKLDVAVQHANDLLEIGRASPADWNSGNAVHKAHLMLGRVAVARGELDRACAELLAAARVSGSPQLDSFGPNMQLALDLLNAGRPQVVLEYLALCGDFWEMGLPRISEWSEDIRSGHTPAFGANLVY